MSENESGTFSSSRAQKFRTQLEASLKDIVRQAKEAEMNLAAIQAKIAKLDKETAKSEFMKIRSKLQGEVEKISTEMGFNSEKFKAEIEKARTRVQDTLKNVKTQVQAIAEAERTKRRGRSRSE